MNDPHPLPLRAARLLIRIALHGLRRAERAVAKTALTLEEQNSRGDRLMLTVVTDPTARMQLIGVRGSLAPDALGPLAEALRCVPAGTSLHLDLTDAELFGPAVVEQIELLVDRLERRHVRIRIVGLDPLHPAFSADPLR